MLSLAWMYGNYLQTRLLYIEMHSKCPSKHELPSINTGIRHAWGPEPCLRPHGMLRRNYAFLARGVRTPQTPSRVRPACTTSRHLTRVMIDNQHVTKHN